MQKLSVEQNLWNVFREICEQYESSEHEALFRYFGDDFGPSVRCSLWARLEPLRDVLSDLDFCKETRGILTEQVTVLDVGCGCGFVSNFLGRLGCKVIGIDLNLSRLNAARLIAAKSNSNVQFIAADVIGFLDQFRDKFDIVWCEQSLHHIEPRVSTLKHLVNRLRVGGKLVISEANSLNFMLSAYFMKRTCLRNLKVIDRGHQNYQIYGNENLFNFYFIKKFTSKYDFLTVKKSFYFRFFPSSFLKHSFLSDIDSKISSKWLSLNWGCIIDKEEEAQFEIIKNASVICYQGFIDLLKIRMIENFESSSDDVYFVTHNEGAFRLLIHRLLVLIAFGINHKLDFLPGVIFLDDHIDLNELARGASR